MRTKILNLTSSSKISMDAKNLINNEKLKSQHSKLPAIQAKIINNDNKSPNIEIIEHDDKTEEMLKKENYLNYFKNDNSDKEKFIAENLSNTRYEIKEIKDDETSENKVKEL